MKNLDNYHQFLLEQCISREVLIKESIITDMESLINSIGAEKTDLFKAIKMVPSGWNPQFSLEDLYNHEDFNRRLESLRLKKTRIESTAEAETFIEKTIDIKYFLLHRAEKSELEKPEYIILQSKKKRDSQWGKVFCYRVKRDMKHFYDKLSSKTIEIIQGEKKYIYLTSDGGVDFILQNVNDATKTFKKNMTNKKIKDLLQDKDISINIIS